MGFNGTEAQLGGVGNAVFVEGPVIAEHVEAGAQVGSLRKRGSGFDPYAQRRGLHGDTETRKWFFRFRLCETDRYEPKCNERQRREEEWTTLGHDG